MKTYPREVSVEDYRGAVPVHVVWEITLACDLKCLHCGSRAGHRRPRELTTQECMDVVDCLADLGTREISLIGGEAYLRRDWPEIIHRIRSHGIYCATQTGGRQLTPQRLDAAVNAGLQGLGVSLDGMSALHDRLRGIQGSFDSAVDALGRAKSAGLHTSVNTQIGADTMKDLRSLMEVIIEAGASHWQIQLTVAMGNAADRPELLLQPYALRELMPLLADLYRRASARGLIIQPGNNIGYFGPFEHLWRGSGSDEIHWSGCSGGHTVLALEADGTVKGCPSLATLDYSGGNVRDKSLKEIWNTSPKIQFSREKSQSSLWGFCKSCYYSDVCRGGCTWTAHSLLGRAGNNPYCHYRVIELEKRGLRERVQKRKDALPHSFAVGEFDLILENLDGEAAVVLQPYPQLVSLESAEQAPARLKPRENREPELLSICRACNCYIFPREIRCPHCNSDIRAASDEFSFAATRRRVAMDALQTRLDRLGVK